MNGFNKKCLIGYVRCLLKLCKFKKVNDFI